MGLFSSNKSEAFERVELLTTGAVLLNGDTFKPQQLAANSRKRAINILGA